MKSNRKRNAARKSKHNWIRPESAGIPLPQSPRHHQAPLPPSPASFRKTHTRPFAAFATSRQKSAPPIGLTQIEVPERRQPRNPTHQCNPPQVFARLESLRTRTISNAPSAIGWPVARAGLCQCGNPATDGHGDWNEINHLLLLA